MGQRATSTVLEHLGIRRHLPGRRRAPSRTTFTRLLAPLDGDALDAAIRAYLAGPTNTPTPTLAWRRGRRSRWTAMHCQAPRTGSSATGTCRPPSPAPPPVTLAQREVGTKTNETAAFRPLLEPLDLTGTVVTFDALHSVKDQVRWLVQEKKAHYIAVIKGVQPAASAQLKALPWEQVPVAHTVSGTGHGRRESRSVKTMAIAANLGGIAFPEARLALRIHRRRQESGQRQTRETVHAANSLDTHQATPADLGGYVRGHWGIENSSHHVRDVVFAEDASTVHTGSAPRVMAALRNLAIGRLRLLGPVRSSDQEFRQSYARARPPQPGLPDPCGIRCEKTDSHTSPRRIRRRRRRRCRRAGRYTELTRIATRDHCGVSVRSPS
ncbi:ISAs1 family transposase [Streptomyces sp. 35M1]|uniref:ISAs1 family transposase n=1 Tax=Streptomyces sp. 35M1 TaxID=3142978 RepID=UPI003990739F